jgi:hypothetical protein
MGGATRFAADGAIDNEQVHLCAHGGNFLLDSAWFRPSKSVDDDYVFLISEFAQALFER